MEQFVKDLFLGRVQVSLVQSISRSPPLPLPPHAFNRLIHDPLSFFISLCRLAIRARDRWPVQRDRPGQVPGHSVPVLQPEQEDLQGAVGADAVVERELLLQQAHERRVPGAPARLRQHGEDEPDEQVQVPAGALLRLDRPHQGQPAEPAVQLPVQAERRGHRRALPLARRDHAVHRRRQEVAQPRLARKYLAPAKMPTRQHTSRRVRNASTFLLYS